MLVVGMVKQVETDLIPAIQGRVPSQRAKGIPIKPGVEHQ